jgi:hypothetical protein
MAVDDALYCCEPNAKAGEFSSTVQPLEWAKKFIGVGHVEADAVITHIVYYFTVAVSFSQLDHSMRLAAGKFPGVAEQVFEYGTQKVTIGSHAQTICDFDIYPA